MKTWKRIFVIMLCIILSISCFAVSASAASVASASLYCNYYAPGAEYSQSFKLNVSQSSPTASSSVSINRVKPYTIQVVFPSSGTMNLSFNAGALITSASGDVLDSWSVSGGICNLVCSSDRAGSFLINFSASAFAAVSTVNFSMSFSSSSSGGSSGSGGSGSPSGSGSGAGSDSVSATFNYYWGYEPGQPDAVYYSGSSVLSIEDSGSVITPPTDVSFRPNAFKAMSIDFTFPSAGTIVFTFSPGSNIIGASGADSFEVNSSDSCAIVVTASGADTKTVTFTRSSANTGYITTTSVGISFSFSSGSYGDDSGSGSLGPDSGGWTGESLKESSYAGGQWKINSTYIGDYILNITIGEASYPCTYWSAACLSMICHDSWSWKWDDAEQDIIFTVPNEAQGSALDMFYRVLVWSYYWNYKLWSNDVSGSWYGTMSSQFMYLNYRVNQILQVLANDKDLEIKSATEEQRGWVENYFKGSSGNYADSDEFNSMTTSQSAFEDFFSGVDSSYDIPNSFDTLNDNGFSFWCQAVADDLNGASIPAVMSDDALSWEQQVSDYYSGHYSAILGDSDG